MITHPIAAVHISRESIRVMSEHRATVDVLKKCGLKPSGWPPANRYCGGGTGGRAASGDTRGTQREVAPAMSRNNIPNVHTLLHWSEYSEEIPWPLRGDALKAYPIRMLKFLARRRRGLTLTDDENHRLDTWLSRMEKQGAVVGVDPNSTQQIYYIDREPGDPLDIPIRREPIDTTVFPWKALTCVSIHEVRAPSPHSSVQQPPEIDRSMSRGANH